jgi:hypothetical protein
MAGGPAGADYDLYLVNASDGTLKSSTGGTVTETLSYTNGATAATVYAKVIAYSVAAAVVLLTALDRVFLGVHFPSDVTAGVLVGSGLVLASYAGYRGWNPAHPADLPDTPEDVDAAAAESHADRADAHTRSAQRPEENSP